MKRYLITLTAFALPLTAASVAVVPAHAQIVDPEVTRQLQDALRRIAINSNDSSALADAGLAAQELGDTRAAIGFLAKADQIYPRSGRVKAGLGRALLDEENPFGALRYFEEAVANGLPLREIAADRGLALDLIGRNLEAQKDYEFALQTERSDALIARYAVSLGISGDVEKAEATLAPLLQKSDRDAWRNRAFILAMNGRGKEANDIAKQTMQREMARAIRPFFDGMPKLTAAQKAAAVHLGHFPASENIGVDVASVQMAANTAVRGGSGADAGLIPLGQPLGEDVQKPRVLAMPDKSPRRRPGIGIGRRENAADRELERAQRKQQLQVKRGALPPPTAADIASVTKSASAPVAAKPPLQTVQAAPRTTTPVKTPPLVVAEKPSVTPGFETDITGGNEPAEKLAQLAVNRTATPAQVAPQAEPIRTPAPNPAPVLSSNAVTPISNATPVPASSPVVEARQSPIATPPVKAPVQLVTFDLANNNASSASSAIATPNQSSSGPPASIPAAINPAASVSAETSETTAPRRALSDIIGAIEIPDEEKETDFVPVDLTTITPAKPKPAVKPEPREEPQAKQVKPEKAEAVPGKSDNPRRYWVQLVTGSNISALKYDFRNLKKKNSDLFGDMEAWTSDWGNTKRMVIGPFDDLSSAKAFDATFRKNGGDSFAWVSSAGTEVTQLTGK